MQNGTFPLPIYVISLAADAHRRTALESQLTSFSDKILYIDAVNGRKIDAQTYFQHAIPFYNEQGRLMTPSEVGCALSHLKAIEKFIESKEPYVLILEDDILANDEKIVDLATIAAQLPPSSVLIAGGQDGIKSSRLLGKLYNDNMYKLPTFSYQYVIRACCYLLTREAALQIINRHKQILTIADWWAVILKKTNINVFYKEIIHHPLDLKNSNLEQDRLALVKKRKKNISDLIVKEISRIFRKIKILKLTLQGYKRL